jgi:protein SERAC1
VVRQPLSFVNLRNAKGQRRPGLNALHPIAGDDDKNRLADIIFVHGLNPYFGNTRKFAFETWGDNYATRDFWPYWLHKDLKLRENGLLHTGVWVLEYDADGTLWRESDAPKVFAPLGEQEAGEKPIVFVCHGLGGLAVKALLERGFKDGGTEWLPIVEQVCGVVFLSTPHCGVSLTSVSARFRHFLHATPAILKLALDSTIVPGLVKSYHDEAARRGIKSLSFHGTLPPPAPLVLKPNSADLQVSDLDSCPVAYDPIMIAKLPSRDNEVYQGIVRFVRDIMTEMNPTVPVIPPDITEATPTENGTPRLIHSP